MLLPGVVAGYVPWRYFGLHDVVLKWSDFAEFGEFNLAFLDATKAAIKAGKSADEAIAGFKMPEKFKDYAMTGLKDNVTKIYAELKK